MKVAGIICEYNPFHNGHARQISTIRETFGKDTAVVAVMSGNYTQRGEPALFDKAIRSRCAVMAGVNLVLELPFPFSSASAEFFAKSGVKLLGSLGVVDILSFGTEADKLQDLEKAADCLLSDSYLSAFEKAKADNKQLGFPSLSEKVLGSLLGKEFATILHSPNNILAIEYLKAAKTLDTRFLMAPVKRNTDYAASETSNAVYASAMAIREKITKKQDFSSWVPPTVAPILTKAVESHNYCIDENAFSQSLLSSLQLHKTDGSVALDADEGLHDRLHKKALEADSFSSFLSLSETKKYTKARIRRAALYAYFGVTADDVKALPLYTQVLAADEIGCALLKQMKKTASIEILTKPCDISDTAASQKWLSDRADAVYALYKEKPEVPKSVLAFTPYIKK